MSWVCGVCGSLANLAVFREQIKGDYLNFVILLVAVQSNIGNGLFVSKALLFIMTINSF